MAGGLTLTGVVPEGVADEEDNTGGEEEEVEVLDTTGVTQPGALDIAVLEVASRLAMPPSRVSGGRLVVKQTRLGILATGASVEAASSERRFVDVVVEVGVVVEVDVVVVVVDGPCEPVGASVDELDAEDDC